MSEDSQSTRGAGRGLANEVAERLQARILDGTFKPGDRLPSERELAAQLRVNRSSLREALKKLEQLRLVKIRKGSGIRVRSPEAASLELITESVVIDGEPNVPLIRDVLEMRDGFYLSIARLALQRAKPEDLKSLVELVRRGARPEVEATEFVVFSLDVADRLARMTQNRVIVLLSASLRRFQANFPAVPELFESDRRSYARSFKLFAHALEARDAGTMTRALGELLSKSSEAILGKIQDSRSGAGSVREG